MRLWGCHTTCFGGVETTTSRRCGEVVFNQDFGEGFVDGGGGGENLFGFFTAAGAGFS